MLARCTGTPGRCGAATPLFPDIARPPNVALFSYIRGPFVYCPVLLELFSSPVRLSFWPNVAPFVAPFIVNGALEEKVKTRYPLRDNGFPWSCWADSNRRPHPYQEIFGAFYNIFRLFLVVFVPSNVVSRTFEKCGLRCFHTCLW